MQVSVAICTWNRANLLDQTLAQMCKLRIPESVEWELLVVNNNCTDNTDEVIASYAEKLPIRRLLEKRQGQSNARNCAIDSARGDLLIFTDDDVLVNREWLAAFAAAAERWPSAGFFGGLIVPWFEHEPPAWLAANKTRLGGLLAARDLGPAERRLKTEEMPYGANMAFRRNVFSRWRFDPELGLKGDNAIRCDETQYCGALHRAGIEGLWVPSAKVEHFVMSNRMTLDYVWKYFEGYGRSLVRIHGPRDGALLFGAPRWMYRRYWQQFLRYGWRRLTRQSNWLAMFHEAAVIRGQIRENRVARRNGLVTEYRERSRENSTRDLRSPRIVQAATATQALND